MRVLCIIIAAVLLLVSCETESSQGQVVFVSAALNYGTEESANYLECTINDQRALSSQLRALAEGSGELYREILFAEENGNFSVSGYRRDWDKQDLLHQLGSLDTSSGDLIIFHYSGHGDRNGRLVLGHGEEKDRVSPEELMDALSANRGEKCLFIDSCYSGKFIQPSGALADGDLYSNTTLIAESPFFAALPALNLLAGNGGKDGNNSFWIMTAASSEQISFDSWEGGEENQESYGAFTYYLALALGYDAEKEEAVIPGRKERITFYSLYDEIKSRMPYQLRKEATPQATLSPLDLVLFQF